MVKIEKCYKQLGARIQTARRTLNMTQVELAKKIGVSRPSLANMEVGRQRIQLHTIFKFEKALNTNLIKGLRK